jgi:hypothetical protein
MKTEEDYPYRCGYAKALLREAKEHLRRTPEAKIIAQHIDEFFESEAKLTRGTSMGTSAPIASSLSGGNL